MKKFCLLILLFGLANCSNFSSPEVVSCSPGNNEEVTDPAFTVTLRFSKPMDHDKVQSAFGLYNITNQGQKLAGSFSWSDDTVMNFTPFKDQITYPDHYSIQVSQSALDKEGNSLVKDFYSKFNLMSYLAQPVVMWTFPANASSNINIQSFITVAFSLPMQDGPTREAFSISPSMNGNIIIESNLLIFRPSANWENGAYYSVTIAQTAKSISNVALTKACNFYFIPGMNFNVPQVTGVYTNPGGIQMTNGQVGIEKKTPELILTFSVPMDQGSFNDYLTISPSVPYYADWTAPDTVNITFSSALVPSTNYTLKLTKEAKSLYGKAMADDFNFKFTTDGFYSLLPSVIGISDYATTTPLSTNSINKLTGLGVNDTINILVSFSGSANMSLPSLFANTKVEYLYGNGDPQKTGKIIDIRDMNNNNFLFVVSSISLSNCYKLSLPGGPGGEEDVLQNYLKQKVEAFFIYSD